MSRPVFDCDQVSVGDFLKFFNVDLKTGSFSTSDNNPVLGPLYAALVDSVRAED